ncbi:hypothetical protein PUMCH_003316 [Australozyma saopauloensis]|uniref:Arrestin C-terminal-like domain-containing protein n=1 Tax=Australozyma saopauloensis TaxID=291208 RepID=A0AAX4HC31_9ASCO|nr:hypothetical protein PUMCH_003316 [[Candida] saopauloensis]
MFHSHSHSKDLAYFDIRLKGSHKNTILVKGNEFEVENIPIEGHVKISTKEDLHIKRISLLLVGEFTTEYYPKSNEYIMNQAVERNCVLKVFWNNLLCSPQGELVFGDFGDLIAKYHKVVNRGRKSRDNSQWNLLVLSPRTPGGSLPDPEALNRSILNLANGNGRASSPMRGNGARFDISSPSGLDSGENSSANLTDYFASATNGSNTPKSNSRPAFLRTKSHPTVFKNHEKSLISIPRSGIDGTPFPAAALSKSDSHSFLLPEGNYSMPFFIHLPSNIPESVEGLSCGKIRYKLECNIERGRFERSFKKANHVIIARTLSSRNVNLTDSIDFSNTWPGKLDFQVSMTRRAVALGTAVPVKLVIVPLIKGLKFHSFSAELVQHSHVTGLAGKSSEYEDIIDKQKLNCHEPFFGEDHWKLQGYYHLPNSLSKATQTCTLKNDIISVKHAIRAIIHIRNADGHISELRAHLPVNVFLSPTHGHVTATHLEVDSHGYFTADNTGNRQDLLFPSRELETPNDSGNDSDASEEPEFSDTEDAPPLYQQHSKDLLYDQSSGQSVLEQLRQNGSLAALVSLSDREGPKSGLNSRVGSPAINLLQLLSIPCYEDALEGDSDDNGEGPAPDYEYDLSTPRSLSFGNLKRPDYSSRSASTSDILLARDRHAKKKFFFHK